MNASFAYVQRSIDAVVRLALRDTQAIGQLDLTADGFFRSFWAMILGAPLFVTSFSGWRNLVISMATEAGHKFDPAELEFGPRDFALSALMYLLLWFVFPFAALAILRFVNQTQRFSALVIAFNWSAILVMLLFNIPLALFGIGLTSAFPTVALLFTIFGFSLYYRFFVAGAALQSDSSTAMAVAAVNVILFFFIVFGVDAIGIWLAGHNG
jgi:hypothetical protein